MDFFAGIDPGKKGAIALVSHDLSNAHVWDYPGDIASLFNLARSQIPVEKSKIFFALEKQQPASGATSSFSIGQNYGAWEALLHFYEVSFTIVAPSVWQHSVLDSAKKNKRDKGNKNASLAHAARMFPAIVLYGPRGGKYDGRADALNIALYARKKLLTGL